MDDKFRSRPDDAVMLLMGMEVLIKALIHTNGKNIQWEIINFPAPNPFFLFVIGVNL